MVALALSTSLRANGSRECAPDDRLREAIQTSARGQMDCFAALAMMGRQRRNIRLSSPRMRGSSTPQLLGSIVDVSGILDHPLSRVTTSEYDFAISRHELPEVCLVTSRPLAQRAQGRPGACCTRGLACDLRKQKCTRAYRAAGAFRPSLRNGFTAYFELSPVNGSFATVAPKKLASRELNASTAAPEPHDFTVRFTHARLRALRVHRISPHVRDDRERPSIG